MVLLVPSEISETPIWLLGKRTPPPLTIPALGSGVEPRFREPGNQAVDGPGNTHVIRRCGIEGKRTGGFCDFGKIRGRTEIGGQIQPLQQVLVRRRRSAAPARTSAILPPLRQSGLFHIRKDVHHPRTSPRGTAHGREGEGPKGLLILGATRREPTVDVVVVLHRQAHLLQVVQALCPTTRLPGRLHRRQQ